MPRVGDSMKKFYYALSRKKPLDCRTDTQLKRCLNLVDLTALGVGSTLGLGLYVLAGQVAANKAGPAVIISFAISALASAFSALCYAEFASRVPKAGSAYAYSYITVGEFVAFIIGWNMILEYVIGAASVARGFSGYIMFVFHSHFSDDNNNSSHVTSTNNNTNSIISSIYSQTNVIDNVLNNLTQTVAPFIATSSTANHNNNTIASSSLINAAAASAAYQSSPAVNETMGMLSKLYSESLSNLDFNWFSRLFSQFDSLTLVIIFIITCLMLYGVKESTNFTMLFTCVNLMVVIVAVCGGIGHIDLHNWRLEKWELPSQIDGRDLGAGGFMPYGWTGVLAGSATCFFGFIGFDTIASSAEEAKDPRKNVPWAIILSLGISFLAYFATAAIQTLIWPYYDQNKIAVLPYIFDKLDMPITYWILLIGALAGLTSSQCGSIYPLPRTMYSMARDSVIYSYFSKVDPKLQTPVRATIVGSLFIGILASMLDIEELADMVSIGTLAAYSLVSVAVLILRYENRIGFNGDGSKSHCSVTMMTTNRISYPDITRHSIVAPDLPVKHHSSAQENYNGSNSAMHFVHTAHVVVKKRKRSRGDKSTGAGHQSMVDKRNQMYSLNSMELQQTTDNTVDNTNYMNNIRQMAVASGNNSDGVDSLKGVFSTQPNSNNKLNQTYQDETSAVVDTDIGDVAQCGGVMQINQSDHSLPRHEPLCAKHSTPIRVKGSRPVSVPPSYESGSNNCDDSDTITTTNASMMTTSIDHVGHMGRFNNDNIKSVDDFDSNNSIMNGYYYEPTDETCDSSKKLISLSIFIIIILDIVMQLCMTQSIEFNLLAKLTIGTLLLIIIILGCLLSRLPTSSQRNNRDAFQVPLVPLIPFLSIFVNTYLMLNLGFITWMRFSIWMLVGFVIYFTYGIWHSTGYLIDD